jgi:hypothetical protein
VQGLGEGRGRLLDLKDKKKTSPWKGGTRRLIFALGMQGGMRRIWHDIVFVSYSDDLRTQKSGHGTMTF